MTILYTITSGDEGTVEFRTRKAAEDWAALLDRDGVPHGPIKVVDVGYDIDAVRAIGGN